MMRSSRMHSQKAKRKMPRLDLNVICDICKTSRAHGNHHYCSKQRQGTNASLREQEPPL